MLYAVLNAKKMWSILLLLFCFSAVDLWCVDYCFCCRFRDKPPCMHYTIYKSTFILWIEEVEGQRWECGTLERIMAIVVVVVALFILVSTFRPFKCNLLLFFCHIFIWLLLTANQTELNPKILFKVITKCTFNSHFVCVCAFVHFICSFANKTNEIVKVKCLGEGEMDE